MKQTIKTLVLILIIALFIGLNCEQVPKDSAPELIEETDKTSVEQYEIDARLSSVAVAEKTDQVSISSPHLYSNNYDKTWTINREDASGIALHFSYFSTEKNYDFVYIYDSNDTLKKTYHGRLGDFWTPIISGATLKIRIVSDKNVRKYGFKINKISYTYPTQNNESWKEIEKVEESTHNYENNINKSWTIFQPLATKIKLHFSNLDTEKGYDFIKIRDINGNEIRKYSGDEGQFWSAEIPGNTAIVVLETDEQHQSYGFKIDRIAYLAGPAETGISKYPFILAHGFFGFDSVFFIDYFYKVKSYLEDRGYKVYTTEVSPFNCIDFRAKQLATQIDDILEETGAEKVNIIAHSQGGLDARYVITTMGYADRVATLSTVSTPHRGTSLGDVVTKVLPGPAKSLLDFFIGTLGSWYNEHGDKDEANFMCSLEDMSMDNMENNFNPNTPNCETQAKVDDGTCSGVVYYQSWAGKSSITSIGTGDFLDPLLYISYAIIKSIEGSNDGIVSTRSAKWLNFRGYLAADHIDEVGHLFGTTSRKFNHKKFYLSICDELKAAGY